MPKLDIKQWSQYYAKLGQAYMPAVLTGAKLGGMRAVAILQRESDAKAFDVGTYRRAWKSELVGQTAVRVYNVAPYAAVIEHGRRAGKTPPPARALIPWVSRKLGIRGDEAKSVAFAVARSIGKKGIKGKFVLGGAMERIKVAIEQEIVESVGKVLRSVGGV